MVLLPALQQKAFVKMISMLLLDLPQDRTYKVVFMQRKMEEVLASQKAMLQRRGEEGSGVDDSKMAKNFEKHLQQVQNWLAESDAFDVYYQLEFQIRLRF